MECVAPGMHSKDERPRRGRIRFFTRIRLIMCRRILFACAALLFTASFAAAQGQQTGTLQGTVLDTSGLALPGATVTVTSPALQGERATVTGASGDYVLRGLPPGRYDARFELSGFATVTQTLTIALGLPTEFQAKLQPAGVTESVSVVGETTSTLVTPVWRGQLQRDRGRHAGHRPHARRHRRARARPHREHAEQRPGLASSGALRLRQRVPAQRRRHQRQPVRHPRQPVHRGRHRGDADPHLRHLRRVRALLRRRGQRHHQERRQPFSGQLPHRPRQPRVARRDAVREGRTTPSPRRARASCSEATFGGPIMRDRLWFFGAGPLGGHDQLGAAAADRHAVRPEDQRTSASRSSSPAPWRPTTPSRAATSATSSNRTGSTFALLHRPAHAGRGPRRRADRVVANYRGVLRANLSPRRSSRRRSSGSAATAAPHQHHRLAVHHPGRQDLGPLQRAVLRRDRSRGSQQPPVHRHPVVLPVHRRSRAATTSRAASSTSRATNTGGNSQSRDQLRVRRRLRDRRRAASRSSTRSGRLHPGLRARATR